MTSAPPRARRRRVLLLGGVVLVSLTYIAALLVLSVKRDCTEELRSAVSVDVRNTAGEPIAPSSVTSGGTQACALTDYGRYVCWEQWKATHYEIVVWHGGRRKTQSVQLGWDGCHVVGHGHLEFRF